MQMWVESVAVESQTGRGPRTTPTLGKEAEEFKVVAEYVGVLGK